MGGFGMIIGGALKGAGAGLAEGNKSRRAEQLEKLAQDRADARSERDMQFRSQEAATARSYEAGESEKSRSFTASENEKSRAVQGNEIGTDSEGNTVITNKGTGATIYATTPDGKKLKLLTKTSDDPEDIKKVKRLVELGIAKDFNDAWNKVKSSPTDVVDRAAGAYAATMKQYLEDGKTKEEAEEAAQFAYDSLIKHAGKGEADAAPAPNTDRSSPGKPAKVEKMKPGELRAPPGDGSAEVPFKASRQQDIDWFKKFAKPGQQIVGPNGDVYTK